MRRRYLGSWTLPSGNSCDVYLTMSKIERGTVSTDALRCEWDRPPSPAWPRTDVEHWHAVTFPAILRAIADLTGLRVAGARL